MKERARAIILRRIPYGEADLVVTFFSRESGRMSGFAKSARASRRRFGGAFEPGTLVELFYAGRRASDLVRIEEARVLRGVTGIVKTLERIEAMARAVALSLAFLQEHDPAPEKFDLLERRLAAIARGESTPMDGVIFELEWLKLCGFATGGGIGELEVLCGEGPEGEYEGARAAGATVSRYIDSVLGRPLKAWTAT